MRLAARALALALSFALVTGSAPPEAFAQVGKVVEPIVALPDAPLTATPVEPAGLSLEEPASIPLGQPLETSQLEPIQTREPSPNASPTRMEGVRRELRNAERADGAGGESTARTLEQLYERSAPLGAAPVEVDAASQMSAPASKDDSEKAAEPAGPRKEPLEALMDKYKVPPAERAMRRKMTQQAIDRVKLDIALFTGNPNVRIGAGDWWMTGQKQGSTSREILIPLEDIFVRAVDERGVEEAVGAAIHEVSHYEITRNDFDNPLTQKYALNVSPPENNLLYNSIEDTRINTWKLLQQPGTRPYFDAIYESEWPENPDAKDALKHARQEVLARSTLEIEKKDGTKESWMPPHVQYANSILHYWRHRKLPPFLKDEDAKAAFESTVQSLDRIRNIHPETIGGILTEPMKSKAGMESLEAIDKEIFPTYEKLIKKSQDQLKQMMKNGAKVKQGGGQGHGTPNMSSPPEEGEENAEKVLKKQAGDVADRIHGGSNGEHHKHDHDSKASKGDKASDDGQGMGGDEPWLKRREKAVADREKTEKAWTNYERYRLKAKELGLIDKVDGVLKQILMPTRHARLSRNHYDEGDEPDLDKHHDDRSQGRLDSPVMRVWNRKVRRSAKISLVLDVSGSMGVLTEAMNSPLDYAVLGIVAWAEVCQKNQLDFEVILFDDGQQIAHPFGKAVNKQSKDALIEAVVKASRGSTNIGAAYKLALDRLKQQQATHRFIIFATDEGHNTGVGPEAYKDEAKKAGIITIAMVIGASAEEYEKHFDYAVRVKEPRDFPSGLLKVLRDAIKKILGPAGLMMTFLIAVMHVLQLWGSHIGLGFGPSAVSPSGKGPAAWDGLASWLKDALGLSLNIEAWKRETSYALRSQPDIPLERALAEGAAKAGGLDARTASLIETALSSGGLVPLLGSVGEIHRVVERDGAVLAAADDGLHSWDGSAWTKDPSPALAGKGTYWVGAIGGRLHLVASDGIYSRSESGWTLEAAAGDELKAALYWTHGLVKLDGKFYLGSESGVFVVDRGEQRLIFKRPVTGLKRIGVGIRATTLEGAYGIRAGEIMQLGKGDLFFKRIGADLFVGTIKGLFIEDRGSRRPELENVGSVTELTELEGELYAETEHGLFVRTSIGWQPAFGGGEKAESVLRLAGKSYVLTKSSLLRWTPRPPELRTDWKNSITASLVPQIKKLIAVKWTAQTPLSRVDDGPVERDGRAIFIAPEGDSKPR
jgi:hypothetical protein